MSVPSLSTTGIIDGGTNAATVVYNNFNNLINYFNAANIDLAQLAKPYALSSESWQVPGNTGIGTWKFYFQVPAGSVYVPQLFTVAAATYAATLTCKLYKNNTLSVTLTAAAGVAPQPAGWASVDSSGMTSLAAGDIIKIEITTTAANVDVSANLAYKTYLIA